MSSEPAASGAISVRTADIRADTRFQTRPLHFATVRRYESVLRSERELPPLLLGRIGGVLYLLGGWHRLQAYRTLRRRTVRAMIVDTDERGALWLATRDNLTHGRPLSNRELREAFRLYVRARQHYVFGGNGELKTYRAIAADLGGLKTHQTIFNWMQQDHPRIAAQMARENDEGCAAADGPEKFAAPGGFHAVQSALEGLLQVENAISGLAPGDDESRGAILERIETLQKALRAGYGGF